MKKLEYKQFTEYLIEYCDKKRITAYELSKLTGISKTYCYKLLKGEMKNPSIKVIRQISVTMKLNYEDYLNDVSLY